MSCLRVRSSLGAKALRNLLSAELLQVFLGFVLFPNGCKVFECEIIAASFYGLKVQAM